MSRTLSFLPNRMPYTNSGAISNSGNKYFTNPKSKISKLNMDILDNAIILNNYLNEQFSGQNNINSNTTLTNKYIGDDIQSILTQQKINSKLNKLSHLDPTLQSGQTTFQL